MALTDSAEQHARGLAEIYFLRGRIFTELKRFEMARAAYDKVLSVDPDFQGAWLNLGNTAFRQEQLREALSFYWKEWEAHPTPTVLHHMGRAYNELGKEDSARWAYQRAIEKDSTFSEAYARLGQLYEEGGALEEALKYSRYALNLAPDNSNYRYIVGSILLQTGRLQKAVDELKKVVEQRSWHSGAHYNLGRSLMRLGRIEKGKHYLARAESLQALQTEIERQRSLAKMRPYDPKIWVKLGDALRRVHRLGKAVEAYSIARSLMPENIAIRNNLAILRAVRGETEAAVALYRSILQRDSTLADVWLNLGVAYARSGNEEKARKAWQKALQYAPDHSTAKAYLARLSDE